MRFLFDIAYAGTPFWGWQRQSDDAQPTVQKTIEHWLSRLYDRPVKIMAASRTDRGAHARAQKATADLPVETYDLPTLRAKLNRLLAPHIFVRRIRPVPEGWRVHKMVASKVYMYFLCDRPERQVFLSPYAHFILDGLPDINTLNAYLPVFRGTHNFRNFANVGSMPTTTMREIFDVRARRWKQMTLIRLHGSGFLKQMVRNIVGATLEMIRLEGAGPEDLAALIDAPKRSRRVVPVPACGLWLIRTSLRA